MLCYVMYQNNVSFDNFFELNVSAQINFCWNISICIRVNVRYVKQNCSAKETERLIYKSEKKKFKETFTAFGKRKKN